MAIGWGDVPGWLAAFFSALTALLLWLGSRPRLPSATAEWLTDDILVDVTPAPNGLPWRVMAMEVNGVRVEFRQAGEYLIGHTARQLRFAVPQNLKREELLWPPRRPELLLRCGLRTARSPVYF